MQSNLAKMAAIQRELNIRKARESFWAFCCLLSPDFYKSDRWHLWLICETLQALYERKLTKSMFWDLCHSPNIPKWYATTIDWNKLVEGMIYTRLMQNISPRFGKSRTLTNFCDWILGKNNQNKIITVSYNSDLASDMSRYVRDGIMMKKNIPSQIVYSDIFPNTKIAKGNSSFMKWALEGCFFNYLGAGLEGTITGKGGNCLVAGTLIITNQGVIPIEKCSEYNNLLSLSLDTNHDKIVFRKIINTKEVLSNEFITLTTNTGREITCTPEHRIFDGRIFKEARYFKTGDAIITASKQEKQNMCDLWKNKRWKRTYLQRMLWGFAQSTHKINMQTLWENILSVKIRVRQSVNEKMHRFLLFYRVQPSRPCSEEQPFLPDLREKDGQTQQKILLKEMRTNRRTFNKNIISHCLSHMQNYFSAAKSSNCLLLERMCEQSSLVKNDRGKQFSFQKWRKLFKIIRRNAENSIRTRWETLFCLWEKGKSKNIGMEGHYNNTNELTMSSYRRKPYEQSPGKFDYFVQNVPPTYSQAKQEYVDSITIFSSESKPVYDLQIEETSNFFANGILVHNCTIIDDPIKNAEESYNDRVLEGIWNWYTGTFLSRSEKEGDGSIDIINHTRWNTNDLCGRVMDSKMGSKWLKLSIPVEYNGELTCPSILPREDFEDLKDNMDHNIFRANYYQEPIDIKGRLFETIKTYSSLPENVERIIGYCDTADEGDDFLCCIVGAVKEGEGFVTDILFTQDNMTVTEPQTAKMLVDSNCTDCLFESNNGGKGFARNVERIIWDKFKTRRVNIKWFHQSQNKQARILTGATYVINHIYFPENWSKRWPDFYTHIMGYQKAGGNAHDDGAETLVEFGKRISGDGNYAGLIEYMKKLKEKQQKS